MITGKVFDGWKPNPGQPGSPVQETTPPKISVKPRNDVMFSDNSVSGGKSSKRLPERQRIVMGPTWNHIVNGIPLGFANVVKRGAIGVIGASGTGLQEVTCRIDQLGAGISQALGTGGHDLSEEIGGISMLFALDALAQDDETRVIVLISKPPSPIVAQTILERAELVENRGGEFPGAIRMMASNITRHHAPAPQISP
ncbi:MAG: hypothetical protein ACLT78_00035 [Escherichia coli]